MKKHNRTHKKIGCLKAKYFALKEITKEVDFNYAYHESKVWTYLKNANKAIRFNTNLL